MKKKRITIEDVARAAGVSRQTVSRAMNHKQDINPTTRDRVLAAIETLGYRPSRLAQGMASHQTHTIGVVIGDVTDPAHAAITRGLQDFAQQQRYNLFLANSDRSPVAELEALHSFVAENVDGIVIIDSVLDEESLRGFADSYRPLVLVRRQVLHPNVATIAIDVERAMRAVVEYLLGGGHVAIGLLTRPGAVETIPHARGYLDTLTAHGIPQQEGLIIHAEPTAEGGYQATRSLLTAQPQVTALATYNDAMAIGALRACVQLGRHVPADCAIFGFDDIAFAALVTPSLSTVRYSKYTLGKLAMQRLLTMISQPDAVLPPETLDVELVIRESTSRI